MNTSSSKPVILLAFANDKDDTGAGFLRGLTTERNGIRDALMQAEEEGWCEVLVEPDVTVDRIFDIFQNRKYQDRIAVFHYGGHAGSYELLLETSGGGHSTAHSEGLVSFLAGQRNLQLVFLNGCSSRQQALDLVNAGIPAVIGTMKAIDDGVATGLSVRFYKGLAAGASIERNWAESVDQVRTERGTSNTRGLLRPGKVEAEDRFPWDIYFGEGAEAVREWSLPKAANDPLFGLELPKRYYQKLPPAPFVGLRPFQKEEAAVFFGRGADIRKLYSLLDGNQPVILLSGKAGVGKSSLLQAGLIPRIEDTHTVRYIPRPETGLAEALARVLGELSETCGLPPVEPAGQAALRSRIEELQQALSASGGFARQVLENELRKLVLMAGETLAFMERWRRIEEKTGRPLLIILDQVEARLLRPAPAGEKESGPAAGTFTETLQDIFGSDGEQPLGKLILCCREEHHDPIRDAIQTRSLPFVEYFLLPLDRPGVVESVEGVNAHPSTRDQYRLEIERRGGNNVADIIADDLLEGEHSPVAPMLQVILYELWGAATGNNVRTPAFSVRMYHELKKTGRLLDGFVRQQIRQLESWQPSVVASGLLLDVLYRHTTPLGTSESLRWDQIREIYADRPDLIGQLIDRCRDLYLLTDVQLPGTSLSHHLLAPVLIKDYSISVLPGQQAARILGSKMDELRSNGGEVFLDDSDLDIVAKGREGMRFLTAEEDELLRTSMEHKLQRDRERRRNRTMRLVLTVIIFLFAIIAGWQWRVSERNYRSSKSNQLAFIAREVFKTDHTQALRIAGEAYSLMAGAPSPTVTQTISEVFHSRELIPFYSANFPHRENVHTAVFSPDGEQVLTASEDGSAVLWDRQGKAIQVFPHDKEVLAAAFSPNGKQVLTLTRDQVKLWELNGKAVDSDSLPQGQESDLESFSTDGTRILHAFAGAPGGEGDTLTGRLRLENVSAVRAPGGDRILVITGAETLRILDGRGALLKDSVATEIVWTAFAPDGRRFLTISMPSDTISMIRLWDGEAKPLSGFPYKGVVNRAIFSADGKQILTASNDHTAKLWDFSEPFVHRLPKLELAVSTAVFSPDGKQLLTASRDKTVRLFDGNGRLVNSFQQEGPVSSAFFSPDGKRVVTASKDNTARIWTPGKPGGGVLPHEAEVKTAVFSPDGSLVLTASLDSTARLWTASGVPVKVLRHQGEVYSAVFSPDGRRILTVSSDSTACLWELDGRLARRFRHGDEVNTAVFSPDGKRIITASADSTAVVWTPEGQAVRRFRHSYEVQMAVFSPDSRRVLTAGGQVKIWDEGGKAIDSLVHQGIVKSIAFSPDGRQILTASVDKSARLWSMNGELLAHYGKHSLKVNAAVFSPDGSRIITASDDGYAIIWRTPRAIYDWLKTAPVYRLTKEEKELFEIIR